MLLAALAMVGAVAATASGCASPGTPSSTATSFVGQWVLVTGSDGQGRLPLDGTYITLTVDEAASGFGRSACSDYRAKIIGQPGPVFVSVTSKAIALCSGANYPLLDERYLADLHAASLGSVDGDYLTLSSSKTRLTFHKVPHFMIGGIVDIPWSAQFEGFTEEDGTNVQSLHPDGSLMLSSDRTFHMGVGACPDLTGTWMEDAGEIVLGHVAHADAPCDTPDDAQNRTDVMSALAQGFEPALLNGALLVTNPRNNTFMGFLHD